METLIPLTIDAEATICSAIRLRAAKRGVSLSDVVNAILRRALTPEIAEVSGESPLAAVLQGFHERYRSRRANGSHRLVASLGKPTE